MTGANHYCCSLQIALIALYKESDRSDLLPSKERRAKEQLTLSKRKLFYFLCPKQKNESFFLLFVKEGIALVALLKRVTRVICSFKKAKRSQKTSNSHENQRGNSQPWCQCHQESLITPGLGIHSFTHSLRSLRSNERLLEICSDRSGQMIDCEQLTQVAHAKRATVSELLRLLMTKE